MKEKGRKEFPNCLCVHVFAQYVHMFRFVWKTLYAATNAIKASGAGICLSSVSSTCNQPKAILCNEDVN